MLRTYFMSTAVAIAVAVVSLPAPPLSAQDQPDSASEVEQLRKSTVAKALKFLAEEGQAEDGTFTAQAGPGLSSLALTAAMRNGAAVDDPMVAKGLKALEGFVQADGGIYGSGRLRNYETCVAMLAFAEANKNGRYNEILNRAKQFVTGLQYGSGNAADTKDLSDPWYGGVGYSGAERPDLSNTSYLMEALRAVETGPDDPAIQRALAFVSRCQNLAGAGNDTQFAALVNDGGFYYEIPREKVDPSTSPDRFTPNGGIRSYGSMTYAGLKSMVYAGLTAEDPRVKAAVQWIKDYYSVEENPGMGTAGLYYYYNTFAASLDAAGLKTVVDAKGNEHDWRAELVKQLASEQNEDGSWTNSNGRWFESDKNLATSFALMSLSYCEPVATQEN